MQKGIKELFGGTQMFCIMITVVMRNKFIHLQNSSNYTVKMGTFYSMQIMPQ